jgi:hypothetical protein
MPFPNSNALGKLRIVIAYGIGVQEGDIAAIMQLRLQSARIEVIAAATGRAPQSRDALKKVVRSDLPEANLSTSPRFPIRLAEKESTFVGCSQLELGGAVLESDWFATTGLIEDADVNRRSIPQADKAQAVAANWR